VEGCVLRHDPEHGRGGKPLPHDTPPPADGPEDPALGDPGRLQPPPDCYLDPVRDGYRADPAALAGDVHEDRPSVALLEVRNREAHELAPAEREPHPRLFDALRLAVAALPGPQRRGVQGPPALIGRDE
jgi:hypothetical protein